MELGGTHWTPPITIVYDSSKISSYLITSRCTPSPALTPLRRMVTALEDPFQPTLAAVGRTQEVLEEYGLAELEVTIAFNMNGEEHSWRRSSAKSEDGNRYLILDDIQLVYEVTAEILSHLGGL